MMVPLFLLMYPYYFILPPFITTGRIYYQLMMSDILSLLIGVKIGLVFFVKDYIDSSRYINNILWMHMPLNVKVVYHISGFIGESNIWRIGW